MEALGYTLHEETPDLDSYMKLRKDSGLTPRSRQQSEGAIAGAWYGCHIKLKTGETVAMGRIIGDGGWYYVISDMATLPEHQGKGLGSKIMETLLAVIQERALPRSYVTLIADPPGVKLYKKFGFIPADPSIGMMKLS